MKWRVFAAFVAVGILWGSAWILVPSLPEPAMLAGAAKFAIAAVLLGIVAAALRTKGSGNREQGQFPWMPSIALGVALIGLPYALSVWAKGSVTGGDVAVIYVAMPLVAAFFGGRLGDVAGAIPAMAIGMGGVAFLVAQGIGFSAHQIGGVLLLVCAVVLGGFSLNYAKKHIRPGQIFLSTAIQCAMASVLLLFLSGAGGISSPIYWSGASVASLTALAAAEGAIAFPLLFLLLSMTEAWLAASLQWLATLVAVAEAGVALRAKPTFQMGLGAVLVLVALLWMMKSGVVSAGVTDVVTLQITKRPEGAFPSSDSKEG